jgi:L-ascorbate metabolism protein UlaG (beta-lactamase superfamily)
MQRRLFLQTAGLALGSLATVGVGFQKSWAQTAGLQVQWLHHSCALFEAGGQRILINPFRPIGCTQDYPAPKVEADLVLLSSRLLDEGAIGSIAGNPRVLFEPGDYSVDNIRIQGVRMEHDTQGGFRFGQNVAWRWTMGGIDIVHLGGAAAPITREQQILLDKPDLLFVPVGGGPKNYDAKGAFDAVKSIEPKLVVPTMYRTDAASEDCPLTGIDAFLQEMSGATIAQVNGDRLSLSSDQLPESGTTVQVFPS